MRWQSKGDELRVAPGQECVMRVVEGVFQIRVLSLDSTDGKT